MIDIMDNETADFGKKKLMYYEKVKIDSLHDIFT